MLDISNNINTTITTTLSRFINYDAQNVIKQYLYYDNTSLYYAKMLAEKRREVLDEINQALSRKNGFNGQSPENTEEEHWAFASQQSPKCRLQTINCQLCGNYQEVGNFYFIFELSEICLCHCNS